MALSAPALYTIRDVGRLGYFAIVVADGETIYDGALCSFDTTTGYIKPFDGTSADRIAGWHFGDTVTGVTAADVPPEASVKPGMFVLQSIPVAGLSTTLSANVGAPVWATDDGTFTVTDPTTSGFEIGNVIRNTITGSADVYVRDNAMQIEP